MYNLTLQSLSVKAAGRESVSYHYFVGVAVVIEIGNECLNLCSVTGSPVESGIIETGINL